MIRWIIVLVLSACAFAQEAGTPTKNQEPAQGRAAEQSEASTQPGATTASTSGFPFDQFQEFTAIMVGSLLSGDDRESHIYRNGNLLRTQGTEGLGYYLTDLKSFETYGMTKLGCLSDSHPFFRAFPFTAARPGRKIERVPEGEESMDGHKCKVEEVTVSSGDLAMPIKLKFWEAEDLQGFPIKVQLMNHGGRGTIQYKDVVLGNIDPSLFVRPDHCKGGLPQPPAKKPTVKKKRAAPSAKKPQP